MKIKVTAIVAQTADGFIARHKSELANWTSKEDKKLFVKLTKQAGVIIMGARTFATINTALPDRRNIVYTRHTVNHKGVETTAEDPKELLMRLQADGYSEAAIIGGQAIYSLFFQHRLVDELYVTTEPIMFGQGMSILNFEANISLELLEYIPLAKNVYACRYKVIYGDTDK